MATFNWIEHKGRQVMFLDFSGLSADELVEAVQGVDAELFPKYKDAPPESILILSDVTDSVASKASVAAVKNSVKLWRPVVKRQAALGLTPFLRVFLRGVNRFSGSNIVAFAAKEEALDWLVDGE